MSCVVEYHSPLVCGYGGSAIKKWGGPPPLDPDSLWFSRAPCEPLTRFHFRCVISGRIATKTRVLYVDTARHRSLPVVGAGWLTKHGATAMTCSRLLFEIHDRRLFWNGISANRSTFPHMER